MLSFMNYIGEWGSKPFSSDMNWMGWFLFIGLLIVATMAWGQILRYITEEV